jgi:RNA polymerase sigma-70 factor (ECF subfamily)
MPNLDLVQMRRTNRTFQTGLAGRELDIDQLIGEYYPYIRRLAYSILDDAHEAEDVAQETFIAAHQSLAGFRAESNPKTWLSAIAINASRGQLRKRRLRQVLSTTLHALHLLKSPPASPEQVAAQNETDQGIWDAVDALDDSHRLPVILRYAHGLSVSEIAQVLDLNLGTVHSRLHYARKVLHAKLGHLISHEKVSDETE